MYNSFLFLSKSERTGKAKAAKVFFDSGSRYIFSTSTPVFAREFSTSGK